MCNLALVYSRLLLEGREGEFYPWYALNCLLLGQDCHRTAYTYGVRDSEPEVYRIIDGMAVPEAERLLASLVERLRKNPRLSDYVKALAVNHLYLNHKYDHVLLSGDILNMVSRRYGWGMIGAMLGQIPDVIETYKCIDEPPLIAWTGIREAYRGARHGTQKG